MNQRERDTLRNKHTKVTGFIGNKEIIPYCLGCGDYIDDDRQPYPCDVIKVLDALEEVLAQVNAPIEVDPSGWEAATMKAKPECDEHPKDIIFIDSDFQEAEADYCPKCGEKL